jgi:hypothetical protein
VQTFNNDIAVNPEDKERLRRLFPKLAQFLIFPELHDVFLRYDHVANAAKRKGRFFGVIAIVLAFVGLLAAAASPYLHKPNGEPSAIEGVVAVVGAALGVIGVLFGVAGGLHSGTKRKWLWNRVMTERLRQFQFQTLALRAVEIARALGNPIAMRRLLEEQLRWFDAFRQRFEGHLPAQLSAAIGDEAGERTWVVDHSHADGEPLTPAESDNLAQIFEAYRLLRFEHQIRYCDYKLHHPGGLALGSLRGLAGTFAFAAFACIVATFLIHIIVAPAAAFGVAKSATPALHFAAVALALAALCVRGFEEGLRPRHEIERYLRYRADMSKLLARFRASPDPAVKLAAMHEAEEVSYEEMRDFLRTHQEALFVL